MANAILVKGLNMQRVRDEFRALRKATIFELAQKTALSVVTVKTVLEEMIAQGEASEGQSIPSNGGRPSMRYEYNPNFRYGIVIYGYQKDNGNLIRLLVINLFGECIRRIEASIENVQVSSFGRYIDAVRKDYPAIGAIVFGLPGVEENGVVTTNDYGSLVGGAFMDYYQKKYNVPVLFFNDVNAAVKGYFSRSSERDLNCVVGIYFPRIYSPGAGLVIGGRIYPGAHHFAGEIGNLPPGTDWTKIDYANAAVFCKAISELLVLYCRIVAPDQIVLYGDFLDDSHIPVIKAHTETMLSHSFPVHVTSSRDFGADFEQGMIISTLERINETLFSAKDN